tara:strand:- start:59 stop:628 length:570 start_codon:yes stop_codon:yes gene_type:complete
MAWKYYKNGELQAECNDVPDSMEDAIIELKEQGHDVSDCVIEPESDLELYLSGSDNESFYGHDDGKIVDDCWSPDYPPEENEYKNTMMFKPLTDEEVKRFEEEYKILEEAGKALKVSKDFNQKVWDKINQKEGIKVNSMKSWWINFKNKWTDEDITYLIGWIFVLYLMIGVVKYQPSILEVILWPFIKG